MEPGASGTVVGVYVYPVKGCRGIALRQGFVGARGLTHDRRWMIVDEEGKFVTQRTEPSLATVDVAIEGDELVLQGPNDAPLRWRANALGSAPRRRVKIWRDEVEATDCGADAAAWATRLLGKPASLVFMPDDVLRPVNPQYARPDDVVGFADAFPLLVASTSSLAALNARMTEALPMDRFRPNVVVDGFAPWAEDVWARILAGSLPIRIAKPCARCVVTTTDQRTGERGVEPLRALAAFRRRGNDILFAQNAVPDAVGTVAIGERVVALETRAVEPFDA
ncbi:MAG TPA: MOSC N-terminal beta barrel domain-containing protein [Polyangiaceae bacterium]|nr:MOSC N-terminal beta barrel domain-containing protein [Polyangiaceae bacterium]